MKVSELHRAVRLWWHYSLIEVPRSENVTAIAINLMHNLSIHWLMRRQFITEQPPEVNSSSSFQLRTSFRMRCQLRLVYPIKTLNPTGFLREPSSKQTKLHRYRDVYLSQIQGIFAVTIPSIVSHRLASDRSRGKVEKDVKILNSGNGGVD